MRTLLDYLSFYPVPATDEARAVVLASVQAWLAQHEVQELLAASWDPALGMRRTDHGVTEVDYEDPDTGQFETLRSRDVTLETVVGGTVYGMAVATSPDREPDDAWALVQEMALRHHLVEAALGKVKP